MKKIIKISLIFVVVLIFMININSVNAASSSISASSSTITKGKSVTINASVNAGAWNLTLSGAGQSKGLVGQTSTTANSSASTSITFKPTKAGSYTFYLKGDITDYNTDVTSNINKSVTITVTEPQTNTGGNSSSGNSSTGSSRSNSTTQKPTTKPKEEKPKSTDNTLSALSIKEGEITPEFNKDVREYAVVVPYEVTEINVTVTPNDSKAKVNVEGNKELKEGENTVTVNVTAEDGSNSKYLIRVNRSRIPLALSSLIIKYENQEGQIIETPLNPIFSFDTLEYTIQDLEYWVEKLSIEATANIEGATIDVQGADALQTGENIITITLKIPEENTPEGEEPKEETIVYAIKVNKLEEPTLLAKIQNWFKGIMGTVSAWFNNNQTKVLLGALAVCIVALIALSIYIVLDYNKYKDIITKVKKVSEINENTNIVEELEQSSNVNGIDINDKNEKQKGGKHF